MGSSRAAARLGTGKSRIRWALCERRPPASPRLWGASDLAASDLVYPLVREPIGLTVQLAADVGELDAAEAGDQSPRFLEQRAESRAFDSVFALELLDQQLGVGSHLDPVDALGERAREAEQHRLVFSDVV